MHSGIVLSILSTAAISFSLGLLGTLYWQPLAQSLSVKPPQAIAQSLRQPLLVHLRPEIDLGKIQIEFIETEHEGDHNQSDSDPRLLPQVLSADEETADNPMVRPLLPEESFTGGSITIAVPHQQPEI